MKKLLCLLVGLCLVAAMLAGCEGLDLAASAPAAEGPIGPEAPKTGSGLSPDDVPLAALLHKERAEHGSSTVYGELLLDKSTENTDVWLAKVTGVFEAMTAAGALPGDLWEKIHPYTWKESVNFTVLVNNQGCEGITCNIGKNQRPPYYVQCTVEPLDGVGYNVSASLPFAHPLEAAGRDALLDSFLAYTGLDVFGDWEKEVYQPREGDLPSHDFNQFLSVANSESADLSVSLLWQSEETDYLMFSFNCTAGVNYLQ